MKKGSSARVGSTDSIRFPDDASLDRHPGIVVMKHRGEKAEPKWPREELNETAGG